MNSMTGFGRSEVETELGKIVVETKTENHRFLDIKIQLTDSLTPLETQISETIKNSVSRGKIRVAVAADWLKNKHPSINTELVNETLKLIDKLKKELRITDEVSLDHLLTVKELFYTETKITLSKAQQKLIRIAVERSLENLNKMRSSEGSKLRSDLMKRMQVLVKLIGKIKKKRRSFSNDTTLKIRERIAKLLEGVQLDEYRLLQEIAYLAEKSDITEELVRLEAHINKFNENFGKTVPVGREMDFLIQEMNREVSTLSAKSKDAEISHFVVELKSELERIKEQVQNIE
ncbi:MAG: YicC family protein [Candidatus Dadabacteria bacterium]|nr:YicC family protein [Candidatus Dadabacteria bacterium]